jgi:hypothetical protein
VRCLSLVRLLVILRSCGLLRWIARVYSHAYRDRAIQYSLRGTAETDVPENGRIWAAVPTLKRLQAVLALRKISVLLCDRAS